MPTASAAASQAPAADPAVPDVAALLPSPDEPERDWRAAIRMRDWGRAFRLLGELPTARRQEPAIRLVTGVTALEAGHAAEAVTALAGLESELPFVKTEILAAYARAAALAGPYEAGATLLLATNKVDDAILAAEALRRANEPAKARAAADRAVMLAERMKSTPGRARLLRASLAESAGDRATALADLRWLVREKPEESLALLSRVVELGGQLSLDERLRVLEKSATAANLESVKAAFDDLYRAHPTERVRLDFAFGKTLLHARRFADALSVLDRVVRAMPASAATEAHFQAARAASRAGRESEAVTRFGAIATARPTSVWTERATLRQAESLLVLGRHREALRAFNRYFSMKKKGTEESAAHGRALAQLGAGEHEKARDAFAAMKKRASPKHAGVFQELEGVAAARGGDTRAAIALWLDLVQREPLTWAAWMAHARLASVGYAPLPPPIAPVEPSTEVALPFTPSMPQTAALLASLGLDTAAEARLALAEDDLERAHPGRGGEALCQLHGELTSGRRRLQVGDRFVKRDTLMHAPKESERWAWRCMYPDAFGPIVAREERLSALPRGLIHAVMRQESAFDPLAASPVGARGLMQLMPTTALRAAEETGLALLPDDFVRPDVNVQLGAHYLAKLQKSYGGNPALTAAAYNAGPHAVHVWLSSPTDRELDLWVARIPFRETRHYVAAVVGNLLRYQFLYGGVEAVLVPSLSVPPAPPLGDTDY